MTLSGAAVLASASTIGFMLYGTNPDRVGPTGITLFFLLIFVFNYALIDLLWRFFKAKNYIRSAYSMSLIAILAGVPTLLLGLQSLGQLQNRDLVLVIVLVVIVIFYWGRKDSNPKK